MNAEPLIPFAWVSAGFIGLIVSMLAWLAFLYARKFWRAWRNERQLQDCLHMRSGFRGLKRRGWLPDDMR